MAENDLLQRESSRETPRISDARPDLVRLSTLLRGVEMRELEEEALDGLGDEE